MTQIQEFEKSEVVRMICDKEYHISHKLYTHFSCDKSEYYFIKEEHIYFRNY